MIDRVSPRLLAGACFLLPLGVVCFAGCEVAPRGGKTSAASGAMRLPAEGPAVAKPQAEFVGNEACKSCHPSEFQSHAHSSHNLTLRLMTPQSLGRLAPPVGQITGTNYRIGTNGRGFAIGSVKYPDLIGPLDLAFGSGKTGMTYVALQGDRLADAQISYFPSQKKWFLTPGHAPRPDNVLGLTYTPEFSRQCVSCHVTTLPAGAIVPEPRFLGVGCEACHGAGSAHIAAMRGGATAPAEIRDFRAMDASSVNAVCGQCHGAPSGQTSTTVDSTHRFQTTGIETSRCYLEGGRTTSCMTCHGAHTNAPHEEARYVAVCLSCHHTGTRPATVAGAGRTHYVPKICPVNPSSKCIGCHMPTTPIFGDSNVPTRLTDHWIHVVKRKAGSKMHLRQRSASLP